MGFYPKATITQDVCGEKLDFSDRTDYTAYAERCKPDTKCHEFDKDELENMCFRELAETVGHTGAPAKVQMVPNPSVQLLASKSGHSFQRVATGNFISAQPKAHSLEYCAFCEPAHCTRCRA